VVSKALRAISLPILIGAGGFAAITLYDGRGIAAALFVFVAWYLIVQAIIWIAAKTVAMFGRWRGLS